MKKIQDAIKSFIKKLPKINLKGVDTKALKQLLLVMGVVILLILATNHQRRSYGLGYVNGFVRGFNVGADVNGAWEGVSSLFGGGMGGKFLADVDTYCLKLAGGSVDEAVQVIAAGTSAETTGVTEGDWIQVISPLYGSNCWVLKK